MSLYCDVVFAEQLITTCALSTPQASSSQKKEQEQEEKKGGKNIGKQARGGERLKAFLFILLETSSNTKPTVTKTFKAFETRGSGVAFSQKKKRLTLVKQNINHSAPSSCRLKLALPAVTEPGTGAWVGYFWAKYLDRKLQIHRAA
ncbi:hypothetical protein TWF569_011089 [Orbilia oligospora]|uniref:Uncharacterized protein n=1 Tax=Orbilia oligospora TaxID=2813651 RepID=A0A7C8NAA6_ORBOL|nr:hypothetical protein TWF102_007984 [Orbilia oligospora]KAF3131641.1 hypothetical protein TWF569_011089 [Orbilia oligospora]KAF3142984.1 hypothetical protein TWF594_005373 [Orbilia oligospora]